MIHDFKCEKCNLVFEDFVRLKDINDKPKAKCPECGGQAKKVFSPSRINMGEQWPQYNVQAGKTFKNRREEDAYFNKIGASRADK
jgi:putative FmdB family regulatory protein